MDLLLNILIGFWPLWVVVAMILALVVLVRMYSGPAKLPYQVRERLVTKAELRFYRALQKAALEEYDVFAMVRIADILQVREGVSQRRVWLNKILAKHIDFVLCDPATLQPRLAIELDDASHNRPDRVERDLFVNHAFESAGLPLLRIPLAPSYDPRELRDLIKSRT